MVTALASFQPETLVGATLDGRYRLVAHLASGGMGAIFRAEHVHLRKDLAVKVLRPDLTSSPDLVERFRREAEIAATLTHENIVRVNDFGRSPEGWLFLVMEYLEGESLFERLRREGALRPEAAVPILVQVCRGLEAAHLSGVIHRDLKPENIFLLGTDRPLAKILDFGIAKVADPGAISDTQAGMVVGTPEYLSPEQAMGTPLDGRADIYAVGLIAWRMLVGRHPFQAQDARGLVLMQATRPVPSLAEAQPELLAFPLLLAAVARACAKEPGDRPASAGQLAADLESSLGPGVTLALPSPRPSISPAPLRSPLPQGPAPAIPFPALPPFESSDGPGATLALPDASTSWTRFRRRHRWLWAGAALVLVAAALGAVSAWMAPRPEDRAEELIASGDAEGARDLLTRAVSRDSGNPRLRALLARALFRLPDRTADAIAASAEALALDPGCLDAAAYGDLAGALSRDKRVADQAAQVLFRAGAPAVPAVLAAAGGGGPGWTRVRALEVARNMGVESRLDRMAIYGGLLSDPDCEVRRAAARRLGELGNPAALPRLQELAQARREAKGALGLVQRVQVCGAAEAAEAAARIAEAAKE